MVLFQSQPLVLRHTCTAEVRDSYNYAPRIISEQNAIADAMKTAIDGEPGYTAVGQRTLNEMICQAQVRSDMS